MKLRVGLVFALTLVVVSSLSYAQGPVNDDPFVLVRRIVDARYFEESALQRLETVLNQALVRKTTVAKGSNLSQVIANQYKFGISNAPQAYSKVLDKIAKLNNIEDVRRLKAGQTLLIPDLPVMAKERYNPAKPANDVPKLSFISSKADCEAGHTFDFVFNAATRYPRLTTTGRPGAKFVEQYRCMPLSQAQNILAQSSPEVPVTFAHTPWTLSFVADAAGGSPLQPLFTKVQANTLKSLLARPAKQKPLLLILDDSWPSDEEFLRSKNFFLRALPQVRDTSRWRLGPPQFTPLFREAKKTSFPRDAHDNMKPAHLHSRDILESLTLLRELEPSDGRVEVIFVPLFRMQDYSQELLIELVHFEQLVHMPGSRLAEGIFPDQITRKRKEAEDIVKSISDRIQADLLFSDQSVVEAVLWFGRIYSEESKRPVFFSFSWTTKRDDLHIELPEGYYGFPIVAAGNEGAKDWQPGRCDPASANTAYNFKRQLIYRSKLPGDVIGVMNVGANGGPDCNSSVLELHPEALALAFPGRLQGTTCGTSFATPRVAWFFAAREAFRDHPEKSDDWQLALRTAVRTMRSPTACAFNQIRFDPVQFLSQTTP